MRVFLTGATGFIGTALVPELINAGHQVLGLTRSDAGAEALVRSGAQAHRGDLDDIASLCAGAAMSDAVIHTAFNHDFSKYQANCEADRKVVEALGAVLAGSGRPFIVSSGTAIATVKSGQLATENDAPMPSAQLPRAASEEAAAASAQGSRVSIMRLAQIHDPRKQGLITYLIYVAREKGISAYIGEGLNRWPAAHVLDTARLYRLALEKGTPGARYHAVAEEGVAMRELAQVIGEGLKIPVVSVTPEDAPQHFGWLAAFAGWDIPASSAQTRQQLDWKPAGPGILSDLRHMNYSTA